MGTPPPNLSTLTHPEIAVATIMASTYLRTNFEDAQVYIKDQLNLEKELDKFPAPRSVHATNSGKKGGKNPWDRPDGRWDLDGINSGKYDHHLGKFTVKKADTPTRSGRSSTP